MDAAAQAATATWTFTTGDFTQPEVVGTVPERESREGPPEEVIAYFSEDVSTGMATFTLVGPKGELEGQLAYYSESPCEPEGPSCYHWHFTPYDPLTAGQYTAEVFGVTDRAGLEMEASYDWSFEVMEEVGGELLAPPAEAPQAEEGGEPAPAAEPPAVPETAEPAAEEEPLEAPAGEGGEIEGGTPGVLYVRTNSYYYFGGQRVAMRQVDTWGGDVVYYLVTDHLGTTGLVLNGAGQRIAETRHYPYGAERWVWTADGSGALPTDYRFTGQRSVGLGLTHMGARFYDSALGRWTSADTIVPDFTNPQSLNRYSFVFANPLRYIDPSGFYGEEAVAAYLEETYGSSWRDMKDLCWLYEALLAAEANDIIMTIGLDGALYMYQVLGTALGMGEQLWGLDRIGSSAHGDTDILGEIRKDKSRDDVKDTYYAMYHQFVGLFTVGQQAHLTAKLPADSTEAHTVSLGEAAIIRAWWTLPTLLIPSPASVAGKVALHFAKTLATANSVVNLSPGPIAAVGNEVIRWQCPWGPAGSFRTQHATIVVSRGLVVQYDYTIVDSSPLQLNALTAWP